MHIESLYLPDPVDGCSSIERFSLGIVNNSYWDDYLPQMKLDHLLRRCSSSAHNLRRGNQALPHYGLSALRRDRPLLEVVFIRLLIVYSVFATELSIRSTVRSLSLPCMHWSFYIFLRIHNSCRCKNKTSSTKRSQLYPEIHWAVCEYEWSIPLLQEERVTTNVQFWRATTEKTPDPKLMSNAHPIQTRWPDHARKRTYIICPTQKENFPWVILKSCCRQWERHRKPSQPQGHSV